MPNDAVRDQLLASLAGLQRCIDACPESEWQATHKDAPFSQVVFHALFYCDYYLSETDFEFRHQVFHLERPDIFQDYEELEYRPATHLYARQDIDRYLEHCRDKIEQVVASMGDNQWRARTPLNKQTKTRLELFIDLARHLQHHAAQLALRLQLMSGEEIPYISHGWR